MSIYRDYAEQYFNLGLRPTCISYLKTKYNITETNPEKSPCHPWRRWQVRQPDLSEIVNLPWDHSNGIGTVLGHGSRCIDIDNCNDIGLINGFLKVLGLPQEYEWVVRTPNGFHIHVISENLPFLTNNELHEGVLALLPNDSFKNYFKRIEIRWANHAVLPPTVINGTSYDFVFLNGDTYPKEKPIKIQLFNLFLLMAGYCGSSNESEFIDNHKWNIKINNFFFRGTEDSSGVPCSYGVYKLIDGTTSITDSDKRIGHFTEGHWSLLQDVFFIDTETTGLIKDPLDYEAYPRIIQIAHAFGSSSPKITNVYVKPDGFTIPKEIEELTGITNSIALENGVPIQLALNSFIDKEISNPIVGYNVDFDLSIIDSEYIRLKKNNALTYREPFGNSNSAWHSYTVSKNYLRDGSQIFCLMKKISSIFNCKYLKLNEAYEKLFQDPVPLETHNAVNDLEILIDCFNLMVLYGYISIGNQGKTLI